MSLAQIFLCYAPADKERVEQIYDQLSDKGIKPWMDTRDILPGEVRNVVIKQAIRDCDCMLICISEHAVQHRGPFQRELKMALDIWQEKLESDMFLIPVRLDDCTLPPSLVRVDVQPIDVDLSRPNSLDRLVDAIQVGIQRRERNTHTNDSPSHTQFPMPSTPPPPMQTQARRPLSNEEINRLVHLLLACPSIQDNETRKVVLGMLPSHIAHAINYHASNHAHVLNIVKTCQNFPGGLEALKEAVRSFDGGTFCMHDVDTFWKECQ